MKGLILCLAALGALAVPAAASDAPLNSIDVGLGAAIPMGAHQFDEIAGQGAAFSVGYFRRVAPAVDLGFNVAGYSFADKTRVVPVATGNFQTGGASYSIVSRFFPWPDSKLSPYIDGGFGISYYSEKVDVTPNPGYIWADTGTRETRRTEASSNGFAGQLGVGIQANFTRRFFVAVESDWHYFTIDKDKFGADSIQVMEAGGKAGLRF